jgi:hypothetical protein
MTLADEREQRAKHPPNCPRCVWTPPLGLVRCLPCALLSFRLHQAENRAEKHP